MRGRLWLNYFIQAVEPERRKYPEGEDWTDSGWTEFMRTVMDMVAEKMNCRVVRRRPRSKEQSGEYLNIDAFFIDKAEYDLNKNSGWDPFVLPRAVAELENDYHTDKISYCLWKILYVHAPIRVLICYQKCKDKVTALKEHLEKVIWQGGLMKGTDGDLLVIIGDDSAVATATWGTYFWDYFSVFEWRNDRLEKVDGLKGSLKS